MSPAPSPAPGDAFAPAFRLDVDGRALAPEQAEAVSEISVTREIGTSDRFEVVLANPFPALPWTHGTDAALFRLGASVSIRMGYALDLRPVFEGEVTDLSPDFPQGGMATLEVGGHTRLHRLGRVPRTQTFKAMTDAEIAARIARQEGLGADCEATTVEHPEVLQCNRTNLDFLRERAGLIGFELGVDDRRLVFRGARVRGKPLGLTWGETLLSFRPHMNGVDPVTEVVVRGCDVATAKAIVGRADAGNAGPSLGREVAARAVEAAFGARRETIVDRQPASQAEADGIARAVFDERAMRFITGSGEAVGMPDLCPGAVLDIDGLGRAFDGTYYVVRTTHTIGEAGYRTRFAARRNASS